MSLEIEDHIINLKKQIVEKTIILYTDKSNNYTFAQHVSFVNDLRKKITELNTPTLNSKYIIQEFSWWIKDKIEEIQNIQKSLGQYNLQNLDKGLSQEDLKIFINLQEYRRQLEKEILLHII